MKFFNDKHVVCVIYDGIENSVFQSQVLRPLLAELDANEHLEITLVSFERSNLKTVPHVWHDRLKVYTPHRLPFFGRPSLMYGMWSCRKHLWGRPVDCVIARGPLAGYVVKKLFDWGLLFAKRYIVQARGLCAQEFRYARDSAKRTWWQKIVHTIIYTSLESVEAAVYAGRSRVCRVFSIEAVSPALKDYLVEHFAARADSVFIAQDDLVAELDVVLREKYKAEVRFELGIDPDAQVYCYSGSYKLWQGINQSLDHFELICMSDPGAVLLILSKDVQDFSSALSERCFDRARYRILAVKSDDVMKYLCAADSGFLFRDADVINWVARPTKMLEYQAAGLTIVHNQTVAFLSQSSRQI